MTSGAERAQNHRFGAHADTNEASIDLCDAVAPGVVGHDRGPQGGDAGLAAIDAAPEPEGAVFPEMVLAMTVIVPLKLAMPPPIPPKLLVLSMTVMVAG